MTAPTFAEALRAGYAGAWRLLRWLVLPVAAYAAIAVWVAIAALAGGVSAGLAGPVAGAVVGIGTFALLPSTWGAYLAREPPKN